LFALTAARLVRKRSEGSTTMIFDYTLAGLVSAGLLFYLTYALLRPERF
jgi:K+-transporting ATPase KdpF subunit